MEHSLPTDIHERRQIGLAQLREMIAVAEEDVVANRVGPFDRAATKEHLKNRFGGWDSPRRHEGHGEEVL